MRRPELILRGGFLILATALLALNLTTTTFVSADEAPDADARVVLKAGGPVGKLSFQITEAVTGRYLPARLYFARAGGGEPPVVGRWKNYLVTHSGQEEKTLPVGNYDVYVSRGTEYTLDHQQIRIEAGKTAYLDSTLERVIETDGFISADCHLHLTFPLREGAIVAAAEGLELLTATDHNILKDYSPYIRQLNLQEFLQSTIGAEIDTAFGHFNSFPLEVNRWKDRTFRKAIRTPAEFFRLIRLDPGEEIIQVNHPRRWGDPNPTGGYFETRVDKETGEFDPNFFSGDFDQFEVFNSLTDQNEERIGRTSLVDQKLNDWYSFLNRGMLVTGVANTDAHGYPDHLPAYPRNYVQSATDNPWEIDPEAVVTALKSRAVTTAHGPYIHFTGDGAPVGSLVSDTDGSVTLHIDVQAPTWVPVEKVEVIRNGEVLTSYDVKEPGEDDKALHFAAELIVKPDRDSWYAVIASSNKHWEAPFEKYSSFSFANPVFVDVNSNGYFDPPALQLPASPTSE